MQAGKNGPFQLFFPRDPVFQIISLIMPIM